VDSFDPNGVVDSIGTFESISRESEKILHIRRVGEKGKTNVRMGSKKEEKEIAIISVTDVH